MMCRVYCSITVLYILLNTIAPGSAVSGTLLINEVYYDHPGSDDGWEYIELINTGDRTLQLEGWYIVAVDGCSGSETPLWYATCPATVDPGGLVLVGGELRTPLDQYRLLNTIENGPDCIMLLDDGGVADLLGYGNITLSGMFEGTPAVDVPAGRSLSRRPDGVDTGDNYSDFANALPSPGRSNFHLIDLAVEMQRRAFLYCPGAGLDISVSIVNTGIFRLEGCVGISLLTDYTGKSRYETEDFVLSPGDDHRLSIHIPASMVIREVVTLVTDFPGDTNSENDTVKVALGASPGDIVINEVMPRPVTVGCEWVELFNRSGHWVDLSGWTIRDRSGAEGVVPVMTSPLAPGSFLVLAEDQSRFLAAHSDCPAMALSLEGSWPRLNDSGDHADVIMLFGREGILVEEIEYGDLYGQERGRSLERFSPDACSLLPGGIWLRNASDEGSSVGEENSTVIAREEAPGTVSLSTDCLSIVDDSELIISGTALPGESGVNISIFDMGGKRIRRIYASTGGARSFGCRWDGVDDSGMPVDTGLYICVIEFLGQGGVLCRRVKECVAVYDGG